MKGSRGEGEAKVASLQEKQPSCGLRHKLSRVGRRTEKAVAMEGEGSDGHVPGCTSDTAGS
jgi:hypothetical protein